MGGRWEADEPVTDSGAAHIGGVHLRMASVTSVGTKYRENYDHARLEPGVPAAAVVDGMGDGPGSMAAGRITIEEFECSVRDGATGPGALRAAVARIHERVGAAGAERIRRDFTPAAETAGYLAVLDTAR